MFWVVGNAVVFALILNFLIKSFFKENIHEEMPNLQIETSLIACVYTFLSVIIR